MAPMYVNCFMYRFEMEHILEPFKAKILMYARFIDDLFFIINRDLCTASDMVASINMASPNIELTMTASPTTVDFLDVRVSIEDNKIMYTLFTKPTDRNTLLHATSFHPNPLKTSLPYSQFLRVYRNNAEPERAQEQINTMWDKFLECGYKKSTLNSALHRCHHTKTIPDIKNQ
ncbi:Hypothetical predicted protein [Pelobates cultripes]|uniref:Helix-turn-helix domain-containing protein n=1 Tax=Pelobates cultripes TaxID=61616 RepID=A0AAD1TE20_PELCU|nr:Hypothetical predicted protein [Pelobates cultripes]